MSSPPLDAAAYSEFSMELPTGNEGAAPLSETDLDRLGSVVAGLSRAVAAALAAMPSREIRSDASLGRFLGLDRVTAHRVARLARSDDELRSRLRRAPGPRALGSFVEGCRRVGVPEAIVHRVEECTRAYHGLIVELGRTQAAVLRRLGASSERGAPGEDGRREALFRAAAAMMDHEIAFRGDVHIFRASERVRGMIDHAHGRLIHGYRAGPTARPLHIGLVGRVERGSEDQRAEFRSVEGGGLQAGGALLEEFSSRPLPLVATQGEGERVRHVIDAAGRAELVDVAVAHETLGAGADPKTEVPPRLDCGSLIREACRAMVLDVWVEREYLDGHVPDLGVYQWSPTLANGVADHWIDRLPGAPKSLRVVSPAASATALWARHSEFTWTLFRKLGWDPERFAGFRCETTFPIYGAGYYFSFDFSDRVG